MKYNPLLGDQNTFFEQNKNLVPFMYKRFRNTLTAEGIEKEDALQEGYLAMCKAYETYNGKSKPGTYMLNCIRHRFLDLLHAARRESRKIYKRTMSMEKTVGVGEELTLHDVVGQQENYLAAECKAFLDDEVNKQIIDMLSDGLNQVEISKKVGMHKQTIIKRVHKIKEKLVQAV